MKKFNLVAMLMVSGCATMNDYRPLLSAEPKNQGKYELDRKSCLNETDARSRKAIDDYQSSGRWLLGGFGLVGDAAGIATSGQEKDYSKNGRTMMDECMTSKGYKVIKQSHCC